MFSKLSAMARSGIIAAAAISMLPLTAQAAPISPTVMPAVADGGTLSPTLVQGEGRDRSANPAYWPRNNGTRGVYKFQGKHDYRPYRRGGRYYRGGGIGPGVALGLGILGGAIIADSLVPYKPRYYRASPHVEWCYARYRSYRASDNTFKPYSGPRRQCISPYY